jgi:Rod binding domain-containing protein
VGDALSRPALQGMPLAQAPLPGAPIAVNRQNSASAQSQAMKRSAQEFEAVFLNEMLAPMFEGLSTDGLGGGGVGEEMFRPMLIDTYAKSIAKAGGVGVAADIIAEFNRMHAQQTSVAAGADTRAPAIPVQPATAAIAVTPAPPIPIDYDEDGSPR